MINKILLANEIIDVSTIILDDFPASYLQLSETPIHGTANSSSVSVAEYEDYLESISLQLLCLSEYD